MSTSLITTKINYRNAGQFVDTVVNGDTNLYVYIGRPQPWDNELEPDNVSDSLSTEYDVWHDMTAMKRVIAQDIRLGFRRIDWEDSTVYDQYDDTADLNAPDFNFYVYTSEGRVFKCISNNKGVASTVEPTQTTGIEKTSDGYQWKYMFTISESLYRKFAGGAGSEQYLPIDSDPTVVTNAVVGSIDQLVVENGGSVYTPSATLPIYVYGDGDENATATCTIEVANGVIQSLVVSNGGDNYSNPLESNSPVMIREIGAAGAIETAYGLATTNANNEIVSVNIVLGGSGYTNGDTINAIIVQSSCKGYAETDVNGIVTKAEISSGYSGTRFRVARATVVGTSATPAVVRPIISPFRGHGASPERELLANYVLIKLTFAYNEGANDFTVQNEFRRIGLIENPYTYGTTTVATAQTLNAKSTLVLSDPPIGAFTADDAINGLTSGAKGIYVDLVDSTKIRYIKDGSTLSNNLEFTTEVISFASGATATITEIINPEVEPYSGDILFINNTKAINRSSDQLETITLVLEY
jgi:hypothetical protein